MCGPCDGSQSQTRPRSRTPGGLFSEELWRLAQSLQIAAVIGDADPLEAIAANLIARQVREIRCADFDHSIPWQQAIAWALAQLTEVAQGNPRQGFADRSQQVGQACRRLRDKGYQISITAYGVSVSEQSQRDIIARTDGLIADFGGVEAAMRICRLMYDSNLIYDGMWLLGDRVPSVFSANQPAVPIGWLFSTGLRHLGRRRRPQNRELLWAEILQLARDFVAALDCQRYSQFEEIDIHPANSWRVLRDSLLWREIFVLPQVPPQVLPSLREAFGVLITPDEEKLFDWRFDPAFDEIENLLSGSVSNTLTMHPRSEVAKKYPNLWKIGVGEVGEVNKHYDSPTSGGARNQSNFIFFAYDQDSVLTLPASFLREAFCQALFLQIWKKLKGRASSIVGKIFERALQRACEGKVAQVHAGIQYRVGKRTFEIDVATREDDRVVLFETKAKSLTAPARSGDPMAFHVDYTDSYLSIVQQLVRHEAHLRQGLTPLTVPCEICHDFRPLKIAVSPLSYGPISDKMLASSLLRSFANVALQPVSGDAASKAVTDKFNKAVRQIYSNVQKLAPKKKNGNIDLFAYFLDVFWLDLGQALYVINRANTVVDAFRPLQFVTFTTRDFWTEVALADMQGLTSSRWRPLPQ
jgi:hypothetical protein